MAARVLPGTTLRVRRSRRQDLPHLQAVLRLPAGVPERRGFRRLLADLGRDVYVAEDPDGAIVGVVSLVYARSLVRGGGLSATLDGACTATEQPGALLPALIAFAEERARRRGCRHLVAPLDPEDGTLRALLVARGYCSGELLTTELTQDGPPMTGAPEGAWR